MNQKKCWDICVRKVCGRCRRRWPLLGRPSQHWNVKLAHKSTPPIYFTTEISPNRIKFSNVEHTITPVALADPSIFVLTSISIHNSHVFVRSLRGQHLHDRKMFYKRCNDCSLSHFIAGDRTDYRLKLGMHSGP